MLRLSLFSLLAALGLGVQSPPAPFFFVQLSDPQFGFFTADKEFAQESANFEFAVATVNRLRPAFVVITGDLVNKPGDAAQIAEYLRIKGTIAAPIPVYQMPGNHDIENTPTPETVAAYRARFGQDHYVFRYQNLTGIVLDSTLIHTPTNVQALAAEQEAWLRDELARAKAATNGPVVVFQHHPWFLKQEDEPDQYFNIPIARRTSLLTLFRASGVKMLVSGHYHQNAVVTANGFDAVTSGAVGKPLGGSRSGMRVFIVNGQTITHKFFELGDLPTTIDLAKGF